MLILDVQLMVIGIGVGIISAMVGMGGGFMIVPILIIFFKVPSQLAVGTSILTVLFSSISSVLGYQRQRRIDYRIGGVLALCAVPGSIAGAYAAESLAPGELSFLLGIFLSALSLYIIVRGRRDLVSDGHNDSRTLNLKTRTRALIDAQGTRFEYPVHLRRSTVIGFADGVLSGLFGMGGGPILVPLVHLFLDIPIHVTVATTVFVICFASLSGAIAHYVLGNVVLDIALYLILGIVPGSQVGALISRRVNARRLRMIVGLVLLIFGLGTMAFG